MRKLIFAGAAIALIAAWAAHAQPATNADRILGTWKVESLKVTSGGEVSYPLGEHPSGFVTMTPERMWLLFVELGAKGACFPDVDRRGSSGDDEIAGGLDRQVYGWG